MPQQQPFTTGVHNRWIPTEVIPWAQGFDGGAFQFATAEDGATTSELNLKVLYQSAPGVPDVVWQNNAVFRQYLRLDLETTSTTITGSVPSVTPPTPPATELEYHYNNRLTLFNSAVVRRALVTNVLYGPVNDRARYLDDPEEINAFIANSLAGGSTWQSSGTESFSLPGTTFDIAVQIGQLNNTDFDKIFDEFSPGILNIEYDPGDGGSKLNVSFPISTIVCFDNSSLPLSGIDRPNGAFDIRTSSNLPSNNNCMIRFQGSFNRGTTPNLSWSQVALVPQLDAAWFTSGRTPDGVPEFGTTGNDLLYLDLKFSYTANLDAV